MRVQLMTTLLWFVLNNKFFLLLIHVNRRAFTNRFNKWTTENKKPFWGKLLP